MRLAAFALLTLTLTSAVADADPQTLRLSTIAPAGTGWAREFSAWARDIEAGTHGNVRIKIYFSAIGGDEFTVLDRIKREQLDGAIGSESCVRLAPSLRVTGIFGLFQSREESFSWGMRKSARLPCKQTSIGALPIFSTIRYK